MRRLLLIPLMLLVAACTQGHLTTRVTVSADTAGFIVKELPGLNHLTNNPR